VPATLRLGKDLYEVGFALADATRLVRAVFDARMKQAGLRGSTWRVLAYLHRNDGMTQTQLAEYLEVSRAAVGQMIDQLEAARFVRRRPDPQDARCWRVYLSDGARDTVSGLRETARALEQDLFSCFSPRELGELSRLVGKLRQSALTMAPHRAEDA